MNVIDQAFVKAFARRTQPQSSQPRGEVEVELAAEPPCLQAADMTVHPQAAESAVMWYDTAEGYLRRDDGHRPAAPLGDTHTLQGPRARRLPAAEPAPAEQESLAQQPAPVTADTPRAAAAAPPSRIDLAALYHSEVALAVQPALLVDAPAPEPFSAVWEVDRLEFSSTVMALFSDPALVQSIGHPLDRAVNEGLQTLLITGDRTGVGQTSVATGIAISAAAAGLRVALVDATSAPAGGHAGALADALNLEVQLGWPEALRAGRSVAEAAVHSIEDQLTVIPQATLRPSDGPTAEEFRRLIAPLRQAFDLVVIDGPCCRESVFKRFTATDQPISSTPFASPPAEFASARSPVDAVILVQDIRNADRVLAKQLMQSLRFHGITGLGLVENFT